jgi:hypothetical protein
LQREQQQRLVIKFDDQENKKQNQTIAKIVYEITTQIQSCEKKIKEFAKEKIDNKTDDIIKLNMQQSLYKNISDFTRKFKLNQDIYNNKYK